MSQAEQRVRPVVSESTMPCSGGAWQHDLGLEFKSLLEVLPAGLVLVDSAGLVVGYNAAAQVLLSGLRLQEAWRDVVVRVVQPRWDDGHDMTLVSGLRVNIATRPLPVLPGQLVMITDVSETRALRDLLERHQRASALGQVTATLAHQLRTPVATALLQLGQLMGLSRSTPPLQRIVDRLKQTLGRMERLVDNMLAFARGGRLALSPITAVTLLEWLRTDFNELARPDFHIELPETAPALPLSVNAAALRSVLLNLAENARDCAGPDAQLRVEFATQEQVLRLDFIDNGPGVPEPLQQQIFQPFVSGRSNGTGLGLAVAETIIRAHGGRLRYEAAATGGACFIVELPIANDVRVAVEAA